MEKVDGIGKSIAGKLVELLTTGSMAELQEMLDATPPGIVEMLGIKGIGPKKIATIWHELGIENTGELYYACNENRLVEAKGFGLKTQDEIRKVIEFRMANSGKFLYAQIEAMAQQLLLQLQNLIDESRVELCGEFRRRCEIITELCFVIGTAKPAGIINDIQTAGWFADITFDDSNLSGKTENGLSVSFKLVTESDFYTEVFKQTGQEEHVAAVLGKIGNGGFIATSEAEIYDKAGLTYIEPELREGITFIEKATQNQLPKLVEYADLKGTLHNHSTWSDGINTLESVAMYCRDELKLQYLGICDHSKSAFYANGLSIERVLQQHEEIEHLNKKLGGFHIFKGIESDILNDGSLDYPDEILQRFDFIVASVHSNLKMVEEKATERLIKAIENPYTTILGHPTGRLLLSRKGYDIDHAKVIDACAANGVVIEINANPLRLDLDWRWHQYALNKGVILSINPDAHRNEGFHDMHYGTLVGRKGGLSAEQCLNAKTLDEIKSIFAARKAVITK